MVIPFRLLREVRDGSVRGLRGYFDLDVRRQEPRGEV